MIVKMLHKNFVFINISPIDVLPDSFSFASLWVKLLSSPDAFYLSNQSASWGLRWTLRFSLSKHNLTYCDLEYSKPEGLNFLWTETAFKFLIGSIYSIKAVKAEPWVQPWESILCFFQRSELGKGPELEIRQTELLNPLTAFGRTLNHTPFPLFL